MKKKRKFKLHPKRIAVFLFAALLFVINPFKKGVWDINAERLSKSFNVISGNAIIEDLSEWTTFEWDALYSFLPYTSKQIIYDTVGYKWDNIRETYDEAMEQTVFVNDGKVVCYLYGYPVDLKIGFDFGEFEGSNIKLSAEDNLSFQISETEDGVKYLKYIY